MVEVMRLWMRKDGERRERGGGREIEKGDEQEGGGGEMDFNKRLESEDGGISMT